MEVYGVVTLVAHHHQGEILLIRCSLDEVLEEFYFFEAGPISDIIDQQEALSGAHVLIPHGTKLLLARCVEDVKHTGPVVNVELSSVGVFDGWIILLNKLGRDKGDGKG